MWRDAVQSWFGAPGRPVTLAVLTWGVLLTIVSARALWDARRHSVYPVFADASQNWQAGKDLYRPRLSADLDQFRYSPLVAAMFVPLSALPLAVGGVTWRLLNAGVYLAALAWCSRTVLPERPSRAVRGMFFLLVIPLSLGSLHNGQSNALVIGLLLATVAGAAAERWNLAAGCVALACLVKVYPIALGLLLAVLYPRKFAGRLAVALGIGLALPFLLKPGAYVLAQYDSWVRILAADDRTARPLMASYRDLLLLCRLAHLPLSRAAYALLQVAGGVGVLGLCMHGARTGWSRRQLLSAVLALSTCWMTVLGPATESCTYILLAPALAWSVPGVWMATAAQVRRGLVLASYGLFTLAAVVCWFPGGSRWLALGLQPLAALLLLAGLLIGAFGRKGAEQWPAIFPGSA